MEEHMTKQKTQKTQCECWDSGCKAGHLSGDVCESRATTTLRRIDLAGNPKVRFCAVCAEDAWESGLFGEV